MKLKKPEKGAVDRNQKNALMAAKCLMLVLVLAGFAFGQYTIPQTTGATAGSGGGGGGGNTWTTSTGWSASGTTTAALTCSPACPAITVPTTVYRRSGDN
jgi:hypothetical protein